MNRKRREGIKSNNTVGGREKKIRGMKANIEIVMSNSSELGTQRKKRKKYSGVVNKHYAVEICLMKGI